MRAGAVSTKTCSVAAIAPQHARCPRRLHKTMTHGIRARNNLTRHYYPIICSRPTPPTLCSVDPVDITGPLAASCVLSDLSFYQRLVGVTIGPLVVLAVLYATYRFAMYHHRSFGRTADEKRQRAKVRHASAALLVLFLASWFCLVATEVEGARGGVYVVGVLETDHVLAAV